MNALQLITFLIELTVIFIYRSVIILFVMVHANGAMPLVDALADSKVVKNLAFLVVLVTFCAFDLVV
jgi:hypothetical protein